MQKFKLPLPSQTLLETEIHVWHANTIDWSGLVNEFKRLLSKDELERCNRFAFDYLKTRFTISHSLLRLLIASYTGWEPSSLEFESGSNGKPFLKMKMHPQLHFNMSHSHEGIAYAFAKDADIGIDIEYKASKDSLDSLAQISLSDAELQTFHALEEQQKLEKFYQLWACKEAILKATGEGLSEPLKKVDLGAALEPPSIYCDKHRRQWSLFVLHGLEGYAEAVAAEKKDWSINCFNLARNGNP